LAATAACVNSINCVLASCCPLPLSSCSNVGQKLLHKYPDSQRQPIPNSQTVALNQMNCPRDVAGDLVRAPWASWQAISAGRSHYPFLFTSTHCSTTELSCQLSRGRGVGGRPLPRRHQDPFVRSTGLHL
jgi:hypothetical protein